MNTKQAEQRGAEHFAQGKQCTPFDCREFDGELYAVIRGQARPAKMYASLRDAFNKGWQKAHVKAVSA